MNNYIAQIKELIIAPTTNSESLSNFFVAKPPEKHLGYIFALIDYEGEEPEIMQLIEELLQKLSNYFYQDKTPQLTAEEKFERALQKSNIQFQNIINNKNINFDINKLNIILALLQEKNIFITTIGKSNAYLVHSITKIDYKIIDILGTTQGEKASTKTDPLKIFSQVISGQINFADYLFFCTDSVLDYLSLKKIRDLITFNNTDVAIEEFKKLLDEVDSNYSLALTIVKQEPVTKGEPIFTIKQTSEKNYQNTVTEDSMNELIRTQHATQKILKTSFFPDLSKYSTVLKKSFSSYQQKIKNVSGLKLPSINKPKIFQHSKKEIRLSNSHEEKIKQPIESQTAPRLSPKIKISPFANLPKILNSIRQILKFRFNFLPKKSKRLFIAIILLIIIFLVSLIYSSVSNRTETNEMNLDTVLNQAQEKKDAALASLIYQDETKARRLLLEAKVLFDELSSKNKKNQTVKDLEIEIEEQLARLRHLVEVDDPTMLANFSNVNSQATVAPFIILVGGKIYSQDHTNQAIYELNPETKNISTTFQSSTKINKAISAVAFSSVEILFLNNDYKVFELRTDSDTISEVAINLPIKLNSKSFDIYNQRLYFLDENNNQIYRFMRDDEGFGSASEWLNEKIDFSEVSSFVVDGNIYLLKNNGQITKLLNGLKVDFEVSDIDPALKSPNRIRTLIDSNYLYILDPPTNRLVVLDKVGKLVIQYRSDKFNNLKDFAVSEVDKKIYLLNGNQVFGIRANHLE